MEAGVDEAGRGPLAGPVVVAAVILPKNHALVLKDSKVLTPKKREALFVSIQAVALSYAIVRIEPEEIDRLNILQATLFGMKQAIEALSIKPDKALIDGNQVPKVSIPTQAVVGGDALIPAISAASILAKVTRDRIMDAYAAEYPQYDFSSHKGYPTKAHMAALIQYGASPIHRRSFSPVARVLEQNAYA